MAQSLYAIIVLALCTSVSPGATAGRLGVLARSALQSLRGGSQSYGGLQQFDLAPHLWGREFDRLALKPFQASAPPHEDEIEALFRHAFFLTHYRLDFVRARQLLERVLSLNPQHVPALTTLVRFRILHP